MIKQKGVKATISGYAGGSEKDPTYEEVASGKTSHTESILVEYDSKEISYKELVGIFWRNIDPTQKNGQFYDLGSQYRTAIFYLDEDQKRIAEASKKRIEESRRFKDPIVTDIIPINFFWKAEEYHQDFYKKKSDSLLQLPRCLRKGSIHREKLERLIPQSSIFRLQNISDRLAQEVYFPWNGEMLPIHPTNFTSEHKVNLGAFPSLDEWKGIFRMFPFSNKLEFSKYYQSIHSKLRENELDVILLAYGLKANSKTEDELKTLAALNPILEKLYIEKNLPH